MRQILIASNNPGKIKEIKEIFEKKDFDLLTPSDVHIPSDFDPEETGSSFLENARLKAKAFGIKSGLPSLADDSGLIVDALNGRPGVYSKRYGKNDQDRITKLLSELKEIKPKYRTARFESVVCIFNPKTDQFISASGRVEGHISLTPAGESGFGYDPVFIPSEIVGDQTFAQLGPEIKNQISHRSRALKQLLLKL